MDEVSCDISKYEYVLPLLSTMSFKLRYHFALQLLTGYRSFFQYNNVKNLEKDFENYTLYDNKDLYYEEIYQYCNYFDFKMSRVLMYIAGKYGVFSIACSSLTTNIEGELFNCAKFIKEINSYLCKLFAHGRVNFALQENNILDVDMFNGILRSVGAYLTPSDNKIVIDCTTNINVLGNDKKEYSVPVVNIVLMLIALGFEPNSN